MPLELLSQFGLLILVVMIAFAISAVVGMLVVRISARRAPYRDALVAQRPRSSSPAPAPKAPAARPSAESLDPGIDPVT